jgi:hypothetical protein
MSTKENCCKNKDNHDYKWVMNQFEDWEPLYKYCTVCGKPVEDYVVIRAGR